MSEDDAVDEPAETQELNDAVASEPDKARMPKVPRWALITVPATLVTGVLLGGLLGIFTPIAVATPSYTSMHNKLTSQINTLGSKVADTRATISDQENTISKLNSAAQEVADRATALDARATALNAREAAVKAREDTVTGKEKVVAANTIPGDGTFIVNQDIQPGQYKSAGGESCYWKRTNASGGTIDNYIGSGPAVVTVKASDALLITAMCAPFTKVG